VRTEGERIGLGLRGYFPPALVLPVALVESSRVQAVEVIHHLHTQVCRTHTHTHTHTDVSERHTKMSEERGLGADLDKV
jgi:hypothetical protein